MDLLHKLTNHRDRITGEDLIKLAKELKHLRQRDDMLSGLEAGGVDNWDWYSESLKGYNKKYYPDEVDDDE